MLSSLAQATENDDVQCTGAAKKMKWTMPRNSALLAQIISTSMKAFITSKANDKSKKDAVKKGALRARAELQLSS